VSRLIVLGEEMLKRPISYSTLAGGFSAFALAGSLIESGERSPHSKNVQTT